MDICGVPVHHVGEKGNQHMEIVVDGDPASGKYVLYYCHGDAVIGFLTVGFRNVHIYLNQAM